MMLKERHEGKSVQENPLSPPVQLSKLEHGSKNFFVAREDLLPGGTKQRAALHYVNTMCAKGYDRFVYPSPFCGFAQVALSYVCKILDRGCTIVAVRDPNPQDESGKHEFTKLAETNGAQVFLVDNLEEAERASKELCLARPQNLKVPLGFDCPEFKSALKSELKQQWQTILETLPQRPRALWLPVGSGTLAHTFSEFVISDTKLHCVDVHVLPAEDKRIQAIRANPAITLFSSPQSFPEAATDLPSIPSNLFYDAKLWRFVAENGNDGDVWWNVAR